MSAAKFAVLIEDDKHVVQKPKFNIVSAPSKKTINLNASEYVSYPSLSNNSSNTTYELGKQLLKASINGNAEELKSLLIKGAPFTADWLGTSPLHFAAQNNNLDVTEILLRAGILKDARTKVDRTPLHIAAYEGYLQIVDTLIQHGAEIDCRDLLGMTPLHWATQNAHREVVDFLIGKGANLTIANKFNLTPLDIAKQISHINADIEKSLYSAIIASQNLVIQLAQGENENSMIETQVDVSTPDDMAGVESNDHTPIVIPLEPHLINELEQNDELDSEDLGEDMQFEESTSAVESIAINPESFSDSLKLLQAHGITLQNENDDTNILNTVMESGHSVVLTDVGKEVLNSVKASEQQQEMKQKKIFTITPEGFLKVTNEPVPVQKQISKPIKVKKIMMKKNKCTPLTTLVVNENKSNNSTENVSVSDMECIMKELVEARQTIEEYKIKLHKKEQEAERYKMQLKLFMDSS